jgi:hypothetical protein
MAVLKTVLPVAQVVVVQAEIHILAAQATSACQAQSIPEAAAVRAAVMQHKVRRAAQEAQACTLFATLGHNAPQAAQLHRRAATLSIRLQPLECTEHDLFCKSL